MSSKTTTKPKARAPKVAATSAVKAAPRATKKIAEQPKENHYSTVGRRKSAIAQVVMTPGSGKIMVNGKEYTQYFPTFHLRQAVEAPLVIVNARQSFDVTVRVNGGGVKGQAEAVRHGISRALVIWNVDLKKTLRSEGFMTRDPRVKERKKPGLKRARRAPQFSKR